MKFLVTGCAGFIGSHLTALLLRKADTYVDGIDCFTPYYSPHLKEQNLRYIAADAPAFSLRRKSVDQVTAAELEGIDTIFHLSAQPGVRSSWDRFDEYLEHNLSATENLARAAVSAGVKRIVFASSSSVYGDQTLYPTSEDSSLQPVSPYGVTKAAGEQLLCAYTLAHNIEVVALRFFTVYGPGQRPDMAINRIISAGLAGDEFRLFGDGQQRRDFTFVGDVVEAIVAASTADIGAEFLPINIGGSGDISMNDLIVTVEETIGTKIRVVRQASQVGDVVRTGADITRATKVLGWAPQVQIRAGVASQVAFQRSRSALTWETGRA